MKMSTKNLVLIALLVIPALFIFKSIFLPGTGVSGDAPYLFPQGLDELLAKPQTWNEWGRIMGAFNNALWLYPINFVYGFIGGFLNGGNDLAVKILFILPAVLISFLSVFIFVRALNLPVYVLVISILVYVFNTYFLLLLDGGQVGVALAYSLFPIILLVLKRLLDIISVNRFFLALLLFNLHIHTDVRIAVIALLTSVLWKTFELAVLRGKPRFKMLLIMLLLVIISGLLSSYWIATVGFLDLGSLSIQTASLQLTSLLNSLTLFQPHWPENEYGKVSPPLFYFVALPAIWIIGQMLKPNKKMLPLVLTLLVFAFLAKGTTPPFGEGYEMFLEKIPFASLFRDSTKFFIPIILFSGILIGQTVDDLSKNKNKLVSRAAPVAVYLFLLFLVHPALFGQLNGALSSKPLEADYQRVADNISRENNLFRTAWFTAKPPFAYHSNSNPAIDARYLADKKPLAAINTGSYDRFNFLTSPLSDEWLELFNLKYLFFKPDEKLLRDEKQREEWDALLTRVNDNPEIKKVDWGLGFGAYELSNPKPRVFGKEKAIVVTGGLDVYDKLLAENPSFDPANQLFFFAEDGLFNLYDLLSINPNQVSFLFNDKAELDMQMNLLKWRFIAPASGESQWANRSSGEYLRWKYEFLINGINTKEFDYNKGVSFSTVPGETIKLQLNGFKEDSVLAIRTLDSKNTAPLRINLNGSALHYTIQKTDTFSWQVFDVKTQSTNTLIIENPGGFHAVNTVALIPKDAWIDAEKTTKQLLAKSKIVDVKEAAMSGGEIEKIDFTIEEPSQISARNAKSGWLVFSSTFDDNWQVYKGDKLVGSSHPGYSAINTFYIPEQSDVLIRYRGQDLLEGGLKVSLTTFVLLLITFFGLKWKEMYSKVNKR